MARGRWRPAGCSSSASMIWSSGCSPTRSSTSCWRNDAVFGRGLKTLSLLTAALMTGAFALVFFYAPNDADQGFIQKIFYLHVPLAIVSLCGFVAGGVYGIRFLRTGDRTLDLRSYVAIHISLILAVGALATGPLWARASWGHWWVWGEPTPV